MKRQTITTQMKKQTRNTEVQINGEETGELPGKAKRGIIVEKRNRSKKLKLRKTRKKKENFLKRKTLQNCENTT